MVSGSFRYFSWFQVVPRFSKYTGITECKCCKEFKDLLDKLSAGCASDHDIFSKLILNKSVLKVEFVKHCYKSNFTEVKEMTFKLVIFFVTIISLFLT